ncbi:hypothetical protein KR093_004678 [Drosophila rubida]|uniref:G protein pathway suppressor 2 n=1 Tax=Drosophila rubida TaxID=30044 RepID=A0AAD4PL07_9MUSC|nr:hypothetical protein KR093_004678 [Drosophila rubida]
MPPASAVNNNNAAAQAAAAERAEKLRGSLKGFILADRQRRQEEYERQVEELRVRREQEARERENSLSLEDTRGQITRLDEQLVDLHQKKHQLVVQLKKVLNDDETRKKNELLALQQAQALQAQASVATAQVFLPPVRLQHHQMPMLQKPPGSQSTSVKRGRSPSPPSQQQQHQAYYKSPASYAQQQPKHDDYRRAADYAKMSWNKQTAQYPSTGTLFYQTTAAPPTTQHQAIYNYSLPLRPAYHVELQSGPSATVSKAPGSQSPSPKAQPMQVLHINLDQPPPISQADLVQVQAAAGLSVQTSKPQVTMEKLSDRYHIEGKHEGPPQGHVPPPPPHLLSEGVIYKPHLGELPLHPNVLQISTSAAQVSKQSFALNRLLTQLFYFRQNAKATGSITQGYAPGRGGTIVYDQPLTRQQLAMLPGQPGAGSSAGQPPHGQQLQFSRRLY